MDHNEMKKHCEEHVHRYVLVTTKDGSQFDAFVESVDDENVYFAVPVGGEMTGQHHMMNDQFQSGGGFGYGYGYGGGGYDRQFIPGYGYGPSGYGYPYYPSYPPSPYRPRRFQRWVLPLTALTALAVLPFF